MWSADPKSDVPDAAQIKPAYAFLKIFFTSSARNKKPSLAQILAPDVFAKSAEFLDHFRKFNIFEKERKSTPRRARCQKVTARTRPKSR